MTDGTSDNRPADGAVDPPTELPNRRLGDVQGLRAVAVLLVVAYHAGLPIHGGFVGVDVFFVISGFVITSLLLRELTAHGRVRFRRFYARRVRRLLPALALVLTVAALLSIVLESPLGSQQDTAVVGIGASLWMANAALYFVTGSYFDNAGEMMPLLHTWSLAVEEQFYLAFPAILAISYRWGGRTKRWGVRGASVAMVMILVASFTLSLWLSYGHGLPFVDKPAVAAFYSAPSRAWEFGIGGLVALWTCRAMPPSRVIGAAAGWVGAALLLAAAALTPDTVVFPGLAAVVPVAGTALLILAGRIEGSTIGRLLARRPMQAIGDVSYGWYLWHWPLIVFARRLWPETGWPVVAAAACALPVAWLSFKYVERPIRVDRGNSGKSSLRLAVLCVSIPIVVFTNLILGAAASWGNEQIAAMALQVRPEQAGYAEGCQSEATIPERSLRKCTWNATTGGETIYLIGDSNAGQYSDGLIEAGRLSGNPVVVATMGGCPVIDMTLIQHGEERVGCRRYVDSVMAWLAAQPPGIVVIAAANEAIDQSETQLVDASSMQMASTEEAKAAVWSTSLARTLTSLQAFGHRVIMVTTIPHFGSGEGPYWNPSNCALLRLTHSTDECGESISRPDADASQERSLAAESAALRLSGAASLDLRSILCPHERCATNTGGSWTYRDGLHITVGMSRDLAPEFGSAIRQGR